MYDKIVNIRENIEFLDEYVSLRNKYVDNLLSHHVTLQDTLKWLNNTDVELYGLVKGKEIIGVILIYVEKGGEITFFVKYPGRGLGSVLLQTAEKFAIKMDIKRLYAWTRCDNVAARRSFEKNGYTNQGIYIRDYEGNKIKGYKWVKDLPS